MIGAIVNSAGSCVRGDNTGGGLLFVRNSFGLRSKTRDI